MCCHTVTFRCELCPATARHPHLTKRDPQTERTFGCEKCLFCGFADHPIWCIEEPSHAHFLRISDVAEEMSFVDLVRKVRAGDEAASAELVRRYEPAIRIAVRARLTDPGLRRLFDSMDICQSVFANFFVRATAGEYEFDKPERLIQLLATMARNRVTDHALQQRAARRDYRRTERTADDEPVRRSRPQSE